jgi:prephenate dehydratase
MLLLEPANEPGALAALLHPFAARGINVARIEARPAGAPWTYRFFVEVDADAAAASAALAGARATLLGSFPRWAGD